MKPEIHPQYHAVEATCVCGNVILTGSTSSAIKMDICSGCHPFFTGTQKIVDTEGRVEKFRKRFAQAEANKTAGGKKDKKEKKSKAGLDAVVQAAPIVEAPQAEAQPEAPVADAEA